MKNYIYVFVFLLFSVSSLFGQMPDYSKEVKEAMKQVSVIPGKWEGQGWVIDQKGEKSFSNITENLQWKLDSTIILLEGIGKKDDGSVVHNALGVLSFNPFKKKFEMTSYLSSGLATNATWEVIKPNEKFKWWFEDGRGGTIRYNITTDGSHWKEEGEYSRDGKQWNKFFEMNLVKVE